MTVRKIFLLLCIGATVLLGGCNKGRVESSTTSDPQKVKQEITTTSSAGIQSTPSKLDESQASKLESAKSSNNKKSDDNLSILTIDDIVLLSKNDKELMNSLDNDYMNKATDGKEPIKNKEIKEDFDGDGNVETLVFKCIVSGNAGDMAYKHKDTIQVDKLEYTIGDNGNDCIWDVGVVYLNSDKKEKGLYVYQGFPNDYYRTDVYKIEKNKIQLYKMISPNPVDDSLNK